MIFDDVCAASCYFHCGFGETEVFDIYILILVTLCVGAVFTAGVGLFAEGDVADRMDETSWISR